MPATRKSVPRDKIAEAKQLYERTTIPTADIGAMLGLSQRTFVKRVHEWGWKRRTRGSCQARKPSRRKTAAVRKATPKVRRDVSVTAQPGSDRRALMDRIIALADREITAVEKLFE